MFTLQILDRGQTSLFPLGDRPVLIGSAASADLRLGEDEVVASHARLEPTAGGWRLVAQAKVLINGRAARAVDLTLGDRIEIGQAVLVVGTSVQRPASADDVLAEAVVRRRRAESSRRSKGRALPIVVALTALGAIAYFVATGDGGDRVQAELAMIARFQNEGDLAHADAAIERLRQAWRDAQDDRLSRVDAAAAQNAAIRDAVVAVEREILDPADERNYAGWIRELQRREQEGDTIERVAARLARASLHETLARRAPRTAPPAPVDDVGSRAGQPAGATAAGAQATAAASADAWQADAERLAAQGLFAQAEAALEAGLAEADSTDSVSRLQASHRALRARAIVAMEELLTNARGLLDQGQARQAVTLIAGVQHRWPAADEFGAIGALLRRAEEQVAAADRPSPGAGTAPADVVPPRPIESRPDVATAPDTAAPANSEEGLRLGTLVALRAQLDAVRAAEESADYVTAARLLAAAADQVRERDPDFAGRLAARAHEAGWLAGWQQAVVAALPKGKTVTVRLRDGRTADLVGFDGPNLQLRGDGDLDTTTWTEIDPASIDSIASKLGVRGDGILGAASLLYRAGDRARAELLLARLVHDEPARKVDVDRAIARGRDEPYDERGYVLQKNTFVSARDLANQKLAKALGGELTAAMRSKDTADWDAFYERAMARGPQTVDALALALRTEFTEQVGRLDAAGIRKQFDKLAAKRAELDKARDFARTLIYDEVKYFYPYKPPAVSSDRFAEYNRVQAEVNARVDALRTLWQQEGGRIKVPTTLRADLDRLGWLEGVLQRLGQSDVVASVDIGWARALPAGDSVGLQDFCLDVAERQDLEEWRRIEAYNAIVGKQMASAVREQLQITNAYRAMFRHRPLALVPSICLAAQGHADEMSKLGYFAHMSPTPGRRTPFERMKLAGYSFGVTENIALVDGAQGAHDAWCRSSGHHRNLLNPRHTEFGIGANGRYWVQNFGSGATYLEAEAWREANLSAGKGR